MKTKELGYMGIPSGETRQLGLKAIGKAAKSGKTMEEIKSIIKALVENPQSYIDDSIFGKLAESFIAVTEARARYEHRAEPAPYKQWGENLEEGALEQMRQACQLPISVKAALMPDAHEGYGLPIGGVLATKDAVIPYAVGMDIACRMKLSVLDLPVSILDEDQTRLKSALARETQFGVGAKFKRDRRRQHKVLDEDWSFCKFVNDRKDSAWAQLGTSGSGNHFAEFGIFTLENDDLGLKAGKYLALMTHSGSRGTGGDIATEYSSIAKRKHPELPHELVNLAWLDLDSQEGKEYWQAMELMGRYAAANHELIHYHVAKNLGVGVLFEIENHHNFAWKEVYDGEELIIHRKGATPAHKGVMGVIPGSMATAAYLVRGKGDPDSLNSASHGAGRAMSRKKAVETFKWEEMRKFLDDRGVTLMSAGLDENPMAYKDIEEVMQYQNDLVEKVAKFEPKLVKMCPGKK